MNKHVKHPMVHVGSLVPIAGRDRARIARDVRSDRYDARMQRWAETAEELCALGASWSLHQASHVAVTTVGFAGEEATGCGGHHYTLQPTDWLRGKVANSALATHVSPIAGFGLGGRASSAAPYLFYGGGHCYHGNEKLGDEFIATGFGVGQGPAVRLAVTADSRARVERLRTAQTPRYAARDVDDSAFVTLRKPRADELAAWDRDFEPVVDFEVARRSAPGRWLRFEVVRRRSAVLPNGRVHADARSGRAMWTRARPAAASPWHRGKLFVEASFLPGDDHLAVDRMLMLADMPLRMDAFRKSR